MLGPRRSIRLDAKGPRSDSAGMHGASFVADFALVLGVAAVTALLAQRFRQPTILAYLLTGLVVGPYMPIPLFADHERVEALAEFGVVLVMFAVGLEFSIAKLVRVLPTSGTTGLVQVGFLAWCGFAAASALGWGRVESVFLAGALCISSTMVVTRVFAGNNVPDDVRAHVLGILVVQDVLAIVIIAALTGIAAGGALEPYALLLVLAKLAAVLTGILAIGLVVVPRLVRYVDSLGSDEVLVVVIIGLCFSIGYLAEALGYSVALGAFVAGVLVAESRRQARIEHLIAPLRDIFAAVFFVSIGMSFDPRTALAQLPIALALTAVVVIGHLLSVTTAGVLSGSGLRKSLFSAFSLGQIGEFAFIIAGVGISAGVAPQELQPILLMVAVTTAFTTPLMIRSAERLVQIIDHQCPDRILQLLSLYEQWFVRVRGLTKRAGPPRSRAWSALRYLVIDAVAAVLIGMLALSWFSELHAALTRATGWPSDIVSAVIGSGIATCVLPLLVGVARNTLALSATLADHVTRDSAAGDSTGLRLVRRLIRTTVHILVTLAVGLPAAALLRPLLPGPFGLPIVLAVSAGFVVALIRDFRGLESELRSGAERIARELAQEDDEPSSPLAQDEERPSADAPPAASKGPFPFPGFEAVKLWTVPEDARASDATLADINLRAATGVVVLTVQRGDDIVTLPTGSQELKPGDVLGLWGPPNALGIAEMLLQGAAPGADGPTGIPPAAAPESMRA